MRGRPEDLSLAEARRMALAAQRLDGPRPTSSSRAALLATASRLGVLQIDAVNVLARAHYVPLFSRHGAYDVERLDRAAYREPRALFEYWAHQASLVPVAMQPLFRWRMERAQRSVGIYAGLARWAKARRAYTNEVLAEVRERGPLRTGELTSSTPRQAGGWWGWNDAKRALEWLFWAGLVTTSSRKNFERLYDVPERVLPAAVLAAPTPSVADAQRELVRHSARALGVATDDDLADYYRLKLGEVRPRLAELLEEGALRKVTVEGVDKPMYVERDAKLPRAATGRALLSPFDPLVWYRPRTERLFGFRYRIEIYTPEHLREHGYYVLPFLHGERLAARVDLKASRADGALLVQAVHLEPGSDAAETAAALALELSEVATWLGLSRVVTTRKGSLARALAAALEG
ncbi:MAG: winged helix-turn-helix protein [Labilithrix sp.]|nr:winged helix-turn-helix protein [Labilithrix sp.]